jgi:hypothetical protein
MSHPAIQGQDSYGMLSVPFYADRLLIISCVGSLMQACTLAETVSQPCPTLTNLISAQSMFSLSASTCLSPLLPLAFRSLYV